MFIISPFLRIRSLILGWVVVALAESFSQLNTHAVKLLVRAAVSEDSAEARESPSKFTHIASVPSWQLARGFMTACSWPHRLICRSNHNRCCQPWGKVGRDYLRVRIIGGRDHCMPFWRLASTPELFIDLTKVIISIC